MLGVPVQLPGEFMTSLKPARSNPATVSPRAPSYAEVVDSPPAHLALARLVYVRRGGCVPPLAPVYVGPYEVLSKHAKTFTIRVGDKSKVVSADRLKPRTGTSLAVPAAPPARGRPAASSRVQSAPSGAADWGGPLWRRIQLSSSQQYLYL